MPGQEGESSRDINRRQSSSGDWGFTQHGAAIAGPLSDDGSAVALNSPWGKPLNFVDCLSKLAPRKSLGEPQEIVRFLASADVVTVDGRGLRTDGEIA